ncbi:hypothetical protein RSOLAG1IB_08956 [Rhizoctonia solani AG-1 IB]|uniref:DRBM domain-containing protein n=1 Tax=Thanatephorus cucumeris (strain AG1-IB / isolate 7/3/14) TaxID=1108050 RepID=A0A0B7FML3_THACB|nr:hypothetical protein RSOLAG1IB_08956 [Rhizoctonia solani AG-1 IB]
MPRSADYTFREPTKELTYSAQMQEWADFYHVELTWVDANVQTNGITEWHTYPCINGHEYPDFVAAGKSLRDARQRAAALIITSPGKLEFARTQPVPPAIYQVR